MHISIKFNEATLTQICEKFRIRRMSLFGSQLTGLAGADSDIDLLVEFFSDAKPTLFDMARIEIELSKLLGGRKVDVRTPEDLSVYFRAEVLKTAEQQYVAA